MLDEGDHPGGEEASGSDRGAGPGDFGDLGQVAGGGDLDPAAGLGRADLVRRDAVAGVDDDFHPVTLHILNVPGPARCHSDLGGCGRRWWGRMAP